MLIFELMQLFIFSIDHLIDIFTLSINLLIMVLSDIFLLKLSIFNKILSEIPLSFIFLIFDIIINKISLSFIFLIFDIIINKIPLSFIFLIFDIIINKIPLSFIFLIFDIIINISIILYINDNTPNLQNEKKEKSINNNRSAVENELLKIKNASSNEVLKAKNLVEHHKNYDRYEKEIKMSEDILNKMIFSIKNDVSLNLTEEESKYFLTVLEKRRWSRFENRLFYDGIGNYRHEIVDSEILDQMTPAELEMWKNFRIKKITLAWQNEREEVIYQFLREKNWDEFTQKDKDAVYATLMNKFCREPFTLLNPYEYYLLWFCHPAALWDTYVLTPLIVTAGLVFIIKKLYEYTGGGGNKNQPGK